MRTAARETAAQIALRSCSKDAGWGEVIVYVIWVKGKYTQSSTYFFQKASASLVKLSASHEEQLLP